MRPISIVINARLSSTRVPGKLLRPFAGSSLAEIALEKIEGMDFFDHRYFAVADPELIEVGRRYPKVELLLREQDSIKAGVNPPSVSFAHYLKIPTEHIFIFNPCQPMLSVDSIKKAYDFFQETEFDSYTATITTRDWVFDASGDCLTHKDPRNYSTNTGEAYSKATHSFHIVGKTFFAEHGYHWTFTKDDPHLIEVNTEEIYDVDNEIDFEIAQSVYRMKAGDLK